MNCHLEYVRAEKVYKLTNIGENILSKEQVLAIVKILIESRAFLKSEMSEIIDKLISTVAADKQELIHNIILNEKHLYVDLNHRKSLLQVIWNLSEAIQKENNSN